MKDPIMYPSAYPDEPELHDKGDIAAQLALRDKVIAELAAALQAQCFDHADNCCADWCSRCEDGRDAKAAALAGAAQVGAQT